MDLLGLLGVLPPDRLARGLLESPTITNSRALGGGAPRDYGNRADGTPKGRGWFGELERPGGGVSTELSFTAGMRDVPLLAPGITKEEIGLLLSGGRPTDAIYDKALQHARFMERLGRSPFALPGEQYPAPR